MKPIFRTITADLLHTNNTVFNIAGASRGQCNFPPGNRQTGKLAIAIDSKINRYGTIFSIVNGAIAQHAIFVADFPDTSSGHLLIPWKPATDLSFIVKMYELADNNCSWHFTHYFNVFPLAGIINTNLNYTKIANTEQHVHGG